MLGVVETARLFQLEDGVRKGGRVVVCFDHLGERVGRSGRGRTGLGLSNGFRPGFLTPGHPTYPRTDPYSAGMRSGSATK